MSTHRSSIAATVIKASMRKVNLECAVIAEVKLRHRKSFVSLAKCIIGETDEIGLDRRGVGNIGYLRFYDLIKEPTWKKRNRAIIDNTSLDSLNPHQFFFISILFSRSSLF